MDMVRPTSSQGLSPAWIVPDKGAVRQELIANGKAALQGMGWVFRRNELTGVIECWQRGEEKEYAKTLVSYLADEI